MDLNQFFKMNLRSIADFEGFSPNEMHGLLYDPFNEGRSPLRIASEIDEELLRKVKIFNDIIRYLNMLKDWQPLKLTPKGNLPRNFCREHVSFPPFVGQFLGESS